MTSATTGNIGGDVYFEKISDSSHDIDADSFGTQNRFTTTTVPGTSGLVNIISVNVANGTDMDSISAGDGYRVKFCNNASGTAAGDLELLRIEIREQ